MTDDLDELELIAGRVPKWQVKAVKNDERDNQEVLRVALLREYGGKRDSYLDAKEKQHENTINSIEESIEELRKAKQEERKELQRIKEQKKTVDTFEEKREKAVDDFIDKMCELGATPPQDHAEVSAVADTWFDSDSDAAVEAIKERASNRDDVSQEVVQ